MELTHDSGGCTLVFPWRSGQWRANRVKYIKCNVMEELEKARQGKKTKVPVPLLLVSVTEGYPHIQAMIARALSVYLR